MMDALSNFHFLRPAWLWLAPLAILVWWQWRRRADSLRGWRAQMAPELLKALVVGEAPGHRLAGYWWPVGCLIATVAVAGPTWKLEPSPFAADAQPLMILLKADASMLNADPPPSPLERGQLKIADLAKARKGQPMGLIAYAGSAHLVLPPTRDTNIVAEMAAEIQPRIMPTPGDRLDLAIRKADKLLGDMSQGGTLLVIADSVNVSVVSDSDRGADSFPTQFLEVAGPDTPETKTVIAAARTLDARVVELTANDDDIAEITSYAERRGAVSAAGETNRWQEAGYWLAPVVALIVAFSFRRETITAQKEAA